MPDTWSGRETPLVSDYQYNNRSELTRMSHPGEELQYSYSYDNIGNRVASREGDIPPSSYVANALNQYTEISSGEITMRLEHDADGNATRTDLWSITYDAYDRPVHFVNLYAGMEGFCRYDSMGRRIEKRMTLRGRPYSHHRYVYRGYLQVAEIVVRDSANCLENLHVWNPAEPVATRLLETEMVITPYGSPVGKRIYLMHDAQKNVTGVYDESGELQSHYTYEPYGKMAAFSCFGSGNAYSKFQYSNEFWDDELEMIYYNYRYLNPVGGRWIRRDPIGERGGNNLYRAMANRGNAITDVMGMFLGIWGACNFPEEPLTIPKRKKDCKKRAFIFIGGAWDGTKGPMNYCKSRSEENDPKSRFSYYHWGVDRQELARTIQAYQKRCLQTKMIVVGHSYGGDTAMDVVAETLAKTRQKIILITLDPVSDFDSFNWSTNKPGSVEYWINAYVAKGVFDVVGGIPLAGQAVAGVGTLISTFSLSNAVASGGGK